MHRRSVSSRVVAILSAIAVSACAPMYVAPTGASTATLRLVADETAPVKNVFLYDNSSCQNAQFLVNVGPPSPANEAETRLTVYASREVPVVAGRPISLYFRTGNVTKRQCHLTVGISPESGGRYEAHYSESANECVVKVSRLLVDGTGTEQRVREPSSSTNVQQCRY
jgi:hypothetical protein